MEHSCKLRGYIAVTQPVFVNEVRQEVELLCGVAVSLAYRTITVTTWGGVKLIRRPR